jgi:hypothetical protein
MAEASVKSAQFAVRSPLRMYIREMKSRMILGGPDRSSRPQSTASGTTETPGVRRPDGGNANGVSLSSTANTKARRSPSTKTGMETPKLAMTIVPTSAKELRRIAEMSPRIRPKTEAKISAMIVSSTVTGRRSSSTSDTGRPNLSENPRSPCRRAPM